MDRDTDSLRSGPVDVLVIGGGIYGAWVACHCAQLGLKTALVEQSDWGSGTSSASSKLLHGGLRYLERFEVRLVRKSLRERQELFARMPHQVRPQRFFVPLYRDSRIGRWRMKAGLWLYDRLAGARQPAGSHKYHSSCDAVLRDSLLKQEALRCGFSYGDCGTDDARMTLEVVDTARLAGAMVCNYVRADKLLRDNNRVTGARLTDVESAQEFSVSARLVFNATGASVFRTLNAPETGPEIRRTKGVHLVMPGLGIDHALLLTSRQDGRVFFLIPWYTRTLLGTTDTNYSGETADIRVERADVRYLLDAANEYLQVPWGENDIHAAFVGLRTMADEAGSVASSVSREWQLDEAEAGLLTSVGGKFTSARADALEAVASVGIQLNVDPAVLQTSGGSTAWHPGSDFDSWRDHVGIRAVATGIDSETAASGARRFGARFTDVIAIAQADPDLAMRIVPELPFCRAELVHAVRHEMARTLVDVLRRRIPLLILTRLSDCQIEKCCHIVGDVLQWGTARRKKEAQAVLQAGLGWQSALVDS